MAKAKKATKKFLQKKSTGRQVFKKKPGWAKRKAQAEVAASDEDPDQQPKDIVELDMDEFLNGDFLAGAGSDGSDDEGGAGSDGGDDELGAGSDDDEAGELAANGAAAEAEEDSESDGGDGGDDGDGVGAQNARFKDEITAHKAQLERLKEADPEFYQYLAATDAELLAFGAGDSDSEGEEGEEEEEEEEEGAEEAVEEEEEVVAAAEKPAAAGGDKGMVTLAQVDSWCAAAAANASQGAMRSLLRAYRVACHHGDSEAEVAESLRLGSSAAYNRLMLFVLREADAIFRRMLGVEGEEPEAAALPRLPRWKKVEPLIKSYVGNTLHLLGQMTEASMLAFVLRRLRASVIFFAPYAKLQRRLLKAALQLFGSADAAPRVQAILLVRATALKLPPPALDAALKGVYRAFSANAKFVNAASVPHINFMAACVVELYGIDPGASYLHAFGFVRQLALLLRQALTSKSKEAYREVYCWQTLNCLELWAKVLAAHAGGGPELRPLVYPVTQLLLGAARLVPTPAYFPLRLRCARALNRLAAATGAYIPVAPLLLEVLHWGDLSRSPKPAPGDKPVEILLQLRVGKSAARSAAFQEEVVEGALELLADHLSQWSCHVAFPELAHLPATQLRRFAKATPVERFRRSARQLADAIERNAAWVGRARDAVEFSPKDLGEVAGFLAKEAAAGTAPVARHAETLRERARARLAARAADAVAVGAELGGGDAGLDEAEGQEAAAPRGSLVPVAKGKAAKEEAAAGGKRRRDAEESEEEEEEEEEGGSDYSDSEEEEPAPVKQGKKGKGGAGAGAAPAPAAPLGDFGDDEVMDYQLSDDEEEAPRRPAPKKGGGGGKKGGPKKSGSFGAKQAGGGGAKKFGGGGAKKAGGGSGKKAGGGKKPRR